MLLQRKLRILAIAAFVLNSVFLTGCETSRTNDPLQNLTDEEIEQLEQEIRSLSEDSVILKTLGKCI
jgi:outer membrane murein-binding lipoprotein Lpp